MSSENLRHVYVKMFLTKTCSFLDVHIQSLYSTDPNLAEQLTTLKNYIAQFINDNLPEQ